MHKEQTDRQTFFFIYIDRLAGVPDVGRKTSILKFHMLENDRRCSKEEKADSIYPGYSRDPADP